MRISLIACGDSARHWDGSGPSIAVNDAYKFGHQPDYLMLLNAPNKFPADRLEIIKKTKPTRIYTDMPHSWRRHFNNIEIQTIYSRLWSNDKKLSKNYLYHSKTSPFASISLAYSWGFNQIVLYGVDFIDHHKYKPGNKYFQYEFNNYKSFCEKLREQNVIVYRINEESNLNCLPIYDK